MARAVAFYIFVFMIGCGDVPAYQPKTFRTEVEQLIADERYADAARYLQRADPQRQADYDGSGYMAVAEDLILLPGVHPDVYYNDGPDDWEIPGTSDAILDKAWQDAATDFATRYNLIRRASEQKYDSSKRD